MEELGAQAAVLVDQIRAGDDSVAGELVQLLYPLVIKIVRGHRPRRMDEDDMAQAVFMKMFAHLDQFSGSVPLEHWVSRIAVNTCLNVLRAEKVRPELREADLSEQEMLVVENLTHTAAADDPAEQVAAQDLVERLLETLPPKDRVLIRMLDLEDRSVLEASQVLGWSQALVKVRAFRVRRRLRGELERLMERRMS